MNRANRAQVVLALGVLILGTAVYFLDRPWQQTIFVPGDLSLFHLTPAVFGFIGQSLPTFAHVFAFCLLTAALLAGGKKAAMTVCLGWFLVDVAFELGQHSALAPALSTLTPPWFAHLPILDQTASYFLDGTFDPLDLLAIASGALAAYVVIQRSTRWRMSHE